MKQLTIQDEIALRQAQRGMDLALENAEARDLGWGDFALDFLKRYAKSHAEFPGFFVTMASEADPNFPVPENERAWGGVWKKAAKLGIVADSGRTMRHPRRHGCKAIVWRSLVCEARAA